MIQRSLKATKDARKAEAAEYLSVMAQLEEHEESVMNHTRKKHAMMTKVRRQAMYGGPEGGAGRGSEQEEAAASAIARARGLVELETAAAGEPEAKGSSAGAGAAPPTPAPGTTASDDPIFSIHGMEPIPSDYTGPKEPLPLTPEKAFQLTDYICKVKPIPARVLVPLLGAARELLDRQPNIPTVQLKKGDRLTVVGDTHGHINSLYFILANNGTPGPGNHYIFNGDFVDRADFGSEIVCTIIAFKLLFPDWVHINRGK